MPILRFMGQSDDLVQVDAWDKKVPLHIEEYQMPIVNGPYIGTFTLESPDRKEGMLVHVLYDGCWSFAPAQGDEDVPIPDWPLRIFTDPQIHRYSAILAIDVPDGTRVRLGQNRTWTKPEEAEDGD